MTEGDQLLPILESLRRLHLTKRLQESSALTRAETADKLKFKINRLPRAFIILGNVKIGLIK